MSVQRISATNGKTDLMRRSHKCYLEPNQQKFSLNPVRHWIALGLLCLGAPVGFLGSAHAQAGAGAEITGRLTDQAGAPVAGAAITMIEIAKYGTHDAESDATGRYTIPNLPAGAYRLEAIMPGFRNFVQEGIILHVGDSPTINIKLEGGTVIENAKISAGAAMVQTEKASVAQVINRKNMVELPLNGRQPTQLVLISGAAVVTPAGDLASSKNFYSSTTISIAGGQGNGTNYLLDGATNLDAMTNANLPFPFPDALQEFSVDRNALPARYGGPPAGVVNIITRSGSNDLHGTLFEFLRNGDANARNYFASTHDLLKRNQFGGTAGGRIITDKLFFFGGYQGTRTRNVSPSSIAYVPTAAQLGGDFSLALSAGCQASGKAGSIHLPNDSTSPISGGQVSNVLGAGIKYDAAALALAKYLPQTGDPCGRVTYSLPVIQNENQWIGRVDWVQNVKHSLFGRYFLARYNQPAFFEPTDILVTTAAGNVESAHSVNVGDTYNLSAAVVNSFHATVTRRTDIRGPNDNMINPLTLGINMAVASPHDFRATVSNGGFAVGCATCSPGHFNVTSYQVANDVSWVRGIHHFGFGVDYIRSQLNTLAGYYQNGAFSFDGSATGSSMLDFLSGTMNSFSQSLPSQTAMRGTIPALYAQDTLHPSAHVTISAGVRWQPMMWPQDYFHRGARFSMAGFTAGTHSKVYPAAPAGALFYGDDGIPGSFSERKLSYFSPRLGLVWDPTGDGRQALRVGAGIMYDYGELFTPQRMTLNPPFANEIDLSGSKPGGFSNPWTTGYNYSGGNPFPPTGAFFPVGAVWVAPPATLSPTTVAQWNVTYQRQLNNNIVGTISYIGNRTTHISVGQELNPAIATPAVCSQFSTGCSTTNTSSRRVLSQIDPVQGKYYANMATVDDGASARYNALLVSIEQRMSHGVMFLANYTWSHCISDADFYGDVSGPLYMNPANRRQDRGDCNFDIPQILNASLVAASSVKGGGLLGHVLGKWQFAPLVRAQSGFPLNVTTGTDASLTGVGLDRPNVVSGVNPYSTTWGPKLQYLNPAAFVANTAGAYGNLGRNVLRGPAQLQVDAAVSRAFAVTERARLSVRAEAFNLINRTNLIAPATGTGVPGISTAGIALARSAGSFGQITSAGDPRILQFALKLEF